MHTCPYNSTTMSRCVRILVALRTGTRGHGPIAENQRSAEAIEVLVQDGDARAESSRHLRHIGVNHVRADHGRRGSASRMAHRRVIRPVRFSNPISAKRSANYAEVTLRF